MEELTVGKLIEKLKKYDEDKKVLIPFSLKNEFIITRDTFIIKAGFSPENKPLYLYRDDIGEEKLEELKDYVLLF